MMYFKALKHKQLLEDQRGMSSIFSIALALIIVVGIGIILLQSNLFDLTPKEENKNETLPKFTTTPAKEVEESPAINNNPNTAPTNWTIKYSAACNVKMTVPPKEVPYFEPKDPNSQEIDEKGVWWQYEQITDMYSSDKYFTHNAMVILKDPSSSGNEYIGGMVQVFCGPNKNKYKTEDFLSAYSKQFTDGTFSGLEFTDKGPASMWGQEIRKVNISGGMYPEDDEEYFFATPDTLYRVRKLSMSTKQITKETTDRIFANLEFITR